MWHEGGAGITRGRCRCGMGGTGEVWQGQLWHGRGAGVPWEGCRYREGRPDPIRALIPYGCLTHTGATTAGAEVLISTTKSTKRANCPAKPPVSMTGLLLVYIIPILHYPLMKRAFHPCPWGHTRISVPEYVYINYYYIISVYINYYYYISVNF